MKFCLNSSECIINFINLFTKYSGLYSATFIVSASYYAIYQLIELKISNNNLMLQTKLTSDDILTRNKRESTNKTVEECKFFYDNIQPKIKELYQDLHNIGFQFSHIKWEINDFTEEDVFLQDRDWHKRFDKLSETNKDIYSEIILTINKIEAFAISFIDGLADKDVGINALGNAYIRQIENIYPFIAIWRSRSRRNEDNFYNKTVELYRLWEKTHRGQNEEKK